MDPSDGDDSVMKDKAEALRGFTAGPLPSSIAKVSGSSRGIPIEKDFHFYYNFDEFKLPITQISSNSQSILESIGSSAEQLWSKDMAFPDDNDDAYDWLVNVNDEVFERFDVSVDEFKRLRKEEEETGVRVMGLVDDDSENGFQLVYGKKKKAVVEKDCTAAGNSLGVGVKVASRDSKTMGTKPKVPFHIPSIPRPQDEYKILVNNANQPFEHVWLQRSEDGSRFIHPLEKFSFLDFVDKNIQNIEPVKPPPVESTSFKLVEEVKDLKELSAKLQGVDEFAVDLEHNSYRSFQGLTCLMQISTRTEDFVIDTLKLRIHIGPYLREVFKDPTKKKVMHGADRDVIWLQRDFGIYICNMFDTGQASRVLKLERNSLEHLLHHYCGVKANKEYQSADWRLRPLPDEMVRYAREDTHYLLYIYDLMKVSLLSSTTEPESEPPLVEVYKRSYDICMQLYEKEVLTDSSYLYIYGVQGADLNAQQLAVVAGLCEWRDVVARAEDESTGYILPNKSLLEIAKQMPVTTSKLRHVLKSKHPYIERNLGSVVSIIRHSIQNAAAFEAVVEHLKKVRMEAESGRSTLNADTHEALPEEAAGRLTATEEAEDLGSVTAGIGKPLPDDIPEPSSHKGNVKNKTDCFTTAVPRESVTVSGQVSGATVQVQKKPSRAFGALLGNSATKRKFDPDKKAKEETKLEQIKLSVNLPFHSYTGSSGHSDSKVKEVAKPQETSHHGEPSSLPATGSISQEIIFLEDDSDVEEPIKAESRSAENDIILVDDDSDDEAEPVNANLSPADDDQLVHREDNVSESLMEKDKDNDEPMSLSDLSSSFKKCFQSTEETRKTKQLQKGSGSESVLQLKPFDYEEARKHVRFGEDRSGTMGAEGDKIRADKGSRKKNSGGESRESERSGGFQQGRRRQAFPASGNRSATFR